MKKVFWMMCIIATALVACNTQPAPKSWVKVEGNKFIDPQGKETWHVRHHGLAHS